MTGRLHDGSHVALITTTTTPTSTTTITTTTTNDNNNHLFFPLIFSPLPEQLSGSDWTLDSVAPLLDLMSYIRTDRLIMAKLTQ